jgi:tRNA threonylcarbamoyl adenosine modification protein YeaZ
LRILSFDTSTEAVQVALLADGLPVAEYIQTRDQGGDGGAPRQQAGTVLLPMVDRALKDQNWLKDSLDCLVVGVGPGSFTGIRTGVVTARTLAQALNLPLIPVCLLECFASAADLPVAIVLGASRGSCFVAAYDVAASASPNQNLTGLDRSSVSPSESGLRLPDLRELIAPSYVSHAELSSVLEGVERWAVAPQAVDGVSGSAAQLTELPKVKNIAMQQAQIAWNRLSLTLAQEAGAANAGRKQRLIELFPYDKVQPLYLRSPSVTVKSNRETAHPQASNGNENQANAPGRH